MAIITCPECSKKLKVADASIGKKVKCSCTAVFIAEANGTPPAPAEAPSAAEKVVVACTECSSKLKVAPTSLGRKMKCPKCAGIFVASVQPMSPAADTTMKAPPRVRDDEDEEPAPKMKGKAALVDDDDELLRFAAAEGKTADEEGELEVEDETPRSKPKPVKRAVEDEEEEVEAAPPAGKPVYPSRLLVNLLVFFLVIAYGVFFALVHPAVKILNLHLIKEPARQPISIRGANQPGPPPLNGKKGGPSGVEKAGTNANPQKNAK